MINENRVINFDDTYNNFVVMVGAPGAGKSFVSNNLVNLKDYKYINVDIERVRTAKKLGYDISDPEQNLELLNKTYTTSDPRNRTIKQLKVLLKNQDKNKDKSNIVFDAGGGQIEVMNDIIKLAKDVGYDTTMISVKTSLETSLKRNRERERTLDDNMVIDYYNKVKNVYDELYNMFDNVYVVTNDNEYNLSNRPNDRINKIK
ncbi:ATP-binding protein [bacterium]|nr:ATP-binding protein [bacterium]